MLLSLATLVQVIFPVRHVRTELLHRVECVQQWFYPACPLSIIAVKTEYEK
jgi:hypothetical protein